MSKKKIHHSKHSFVFFMSEINEGLLRGNIRRFYPETVSSFPHHNPFNSNSHSTSSASGKFINPLYHLFCVPFLCLTNHRTTATLDAEEEFPASNKSQSRGNSAYYLFIWMKNFNKTLAARSVPSFSTASTQGSVLRCACEVRWTLPDPEWTTLGMAWAGLMLNDARSCQMEGMRAERCESQMESRKPKQDERPGVTIGQPEQL